MKTGKSIKELEAEMLNGQKLQGPITAEEVNFMLKNKQMEDKYVIEKHFRNRNILIPHLFLLICRFPLFTAIHKICSGTIQAKDLIDCIRNHPEHM